MGILILQFGRVQNKLKNHYTLQLDLPDASGIREGVPVRLGGKDIGYVTKDPVLKSDFSGLRMELKIFSATRIPRQSTFTVGTSGFMGDSYVKVSLPEKRGGSFFQPGELIVGAQAGGLDDIQGSAEHILQEVSKAIGDVQDTVSNLDSLFNKIEKGVLDDENVSNVKLILSELKESSQNINQMTQKLDPIVSNADDTLKEAKDAASQVDGTLSVTREAMEEITAAMKSIQTTMDTADPSLEDLRDVLRKTNHTLDQIEHGNGLAAALINDSELRRDLESLIDKLNRNGVLFYPREKNRKPVKSSPEKPEQKEGQTEKRGPFQWLKLKHTH